MVTRILPEAEWPRIADTGCVVDKTWADKATTGCVISVERGQQILATAFVFLAGDSTPHVDGLWVDESFRGRIGMQRNLLRGIKWAVEHLGGSRTIPIDAAVWMNRPERRAHGVRI